MAVTVGESAAEAYGRMTGAAAMRRVRGAAVGFSLIAAMACMTQIDHGLPQERIVLAYAALGVLLVEPVELFLRERARWWSALAAGPVVALAAQGLQDKPAAIGLGISVLASRTLFGSSRMALVRTAMLIVSLVTLMFAGPTLNGGPAPDPGMVVVPLLVLAPFSLLLRLLYAALNLQKVLAQREALMAGTSRALLEAVDIAKAEVVIRSSLLRLAEITDGLHVDVRAADAAVDPDAWTVPLGASAEVLVLSGPVSERPEIRTLVSTVADQLELVRANHNAHRELYTMAHHDLLTSLCNRRAFFSQLTASLGEGARPGHLGLLLIDLDEFKAVNDIHGHAAGDAVLVEVSRRMRDVAGDRATSARFGGDEFAILVPLASPDDLMPLGERIRDAIGRPISWGQVVVQVGASIGAADAVPGQNVSELMRCADVAMYEAKAQGKNLVVRHQPQPA